MSDLTIVPCDDFALDGAGSAPAWKHTDWLPIVQAAGAAVPGYATKTKLLHSPTGFYALVDCEDQRLTCTGKPDQSDIFMEDVIEVFLWTDESQPLYFEYELSPLDAELVLVVPNQQGSFHGWLPFAYQGRRRCRHATQVRGGAKAAGVPCTGWSAELFIPYALLRGLGNVPPKPDSQWRINVTRIDYDGGAPRHFSLSPGTGANFHLYQQFRRATFAALPVDSV